MDTSLRGPIPSTTDDATLDETEAREVLLDLAHDGLGRVPQELVVDHVLSVTRGRGADFAVQRAGLEALLRRDAAREQDRLRVSARPAGPFGAYATRRPRADERPYRTLLRSVRPLSASCDCPDFLRNALGACKHVLAVLHDLARRPVAWRAALEAGAGAQPPRLAWDPVRPLLGDGDWLAQVEWLAADGTPPPRAPGGRWKARREGVHRLELAAATAEEPARRLQLVETLAAVVRAAGRRRDPALAALLVAERERLGSIVEDRLDGRTLRARLRTLERRLYPYQVAGVEAFLARGRLLLADDMGLGKTAQAIAAAHVLWEAGRVQRGLIVVPASLKPQWLREWRGFTKAPAALVEGGPDERRAAFESTRRGFLIVNYEQILRDLDVMRAWKPDLVVLDEAQRIKNWATKTAACVSALQPRYRLVLTGTPMENRLDELASILEWVDDRALAPRWRLGPLHLVQQASGSAPGGARHLDTLRARLRGCMLRRLRRDVLSQLPARTDTTVPVELTPEQAEEHQALDQPIAQLAAIGRRRPLTRAEFLKLMALLSTQRIVANGLAQLQFTEVWPDLEGRRPDAALLRGLAAPKLQELRGLIEQVVIEQGRKVVVFSQWRRMLTLAQWAVSDLLDKHGLRAVFFTGRESPKRRTQNIVDFHDDQGTRVLFATDAGGVGLNLQRAATCCINIELPWNPAVLEQRIARIHRLGQAHPIDVYTLLSQGSIEERIAALVGDKRALFTGLFDGTSDEIGFDRAGSFLTRLGRLVDPEARPPAGLDADASPGDVDALVEQASEAGDAPAAADAAPRGAAPALPTPEALGALLSSIRVAPGEGGSLRLEAPPEAARTLACVLEGFAALLRQADSPR